MDCGRVDGRIVADFERRLTATTAGGCRVAAGKSRHAPYADGCLAPPPGGASVGVASVGFWSGEVDAHRLVLAALLDLAALGERALVSLGRRLLDHEREATRPESPSRDDVCLGSEQGDVGGEVDPGKQTDHEAEGAVDVAGVLEHVSDVVAAEGLQQLVEHAGRDCTAAQLPPADLACHEQAETEPEEADVQCSRERERADLPREP